VGQAIAALDQSITNGSEEPSMFLLRGKALLESGELDDRFHETGGHGTGGLFVDSSFAGV
jgi:hypothetical protein